MNWSGSHFSESRCPFRLSNTLAGMQGERICEDGRAADGSEADGGEVTQVGLGMELVWDRRLCAGD
jgi:hypothetical protein